MTDNMPVSGPGLKKARHGRPPPARKYPRRPRLPITLKPAPPEKATVLQKLRERQKQPGCRNCGFELAVFVFNRRAKVLVCDNFGCALWRNPQGYIVVERPPTPEQLEIEKQLEERIGLLK